MTLIEPDNRELDLYSSQGLNVDTAIIMPWTDNVICCVNAEYPFGLFLSFPFGWFAITLFVQIKAHYLLSYTYTSGKTAANVNCRTWAYTYMWKRGQPQLMADSPGKPHIVCDAFLHN